MNLHSGHRPKRRFEDLFRLPTALADNNDLVSKIFRLEIEHSFINDVIGVVFEGGTAADVVDGEAAIAIYRNAFVAQMQHAPTHERRI